MLDFCSCFISLPTCQPTHVSVIKDDWTLTGCQTCDPCKKKPPTPAKQHTWSTLPTIYKHVCSLCQDNVCRSNMRRHSVSHLNSCNGNSRTQQTPRNVHNWHHATTTFTEFVRHDMYKLLSLHWRKCKGKLTHTMTHQVVVCWQYTSAR